jgi:hypothetical protein
LQPKEFRDIKQKQCDCEACSKSSLAAAAATSEEEKSDVVKKDAPTCLYAFSKDHKQQHNFVLALLEQQYEHKRLGISDPKGLFQFSRSVTKFSKQRAREQGKLDAEEAKEISREEIADVIDQALDVIGDGSDFSW